MITVYVCECIDNDLGEVVQVGMSLDKDIIQNKADELYERVKAKRKFYNRFTNYGINTYIVTTDEYIAFN